MLDGLFMLLSLSVVMALASFLAGALPLSMTLSQSQLRLISTIGMGVLVGTSLIVIIPEGIDAVYTATPSSSTHTRRHVSLEKLNGRGLGLDMAPIMAIPNLRMRTPEAADTDAFNALPGPVMTDIEYKATKSSPKETENDMKAKETADDGADTSPPQSTDEHDHEGDRSPHTYVGLALILGFILMYLIDKLPRHASENLQPPAAPRHISLDNLSQGLHNNSMDSSRDEEAESFLHSLAPTPKQSRSLATTTGLVIHSAADGIAMGASASTSNERLGFIIFIAIMVHKAPAAFGLTSVLLKQGLSKRAARGHLIIFSLAAPFGALMTWLIVGILGGGGFGGEHGQWWTGMLLLFSAGTFLYVAMHAMQEDGANHDHASTNGYENGNATTRKAPRPQMRDTLAAVAGMLIPLLTQFGHHH